ncbi:MAG: DNA-binding transcriptional LysR family regulator, partial [Myxococcota bacterium]
METNLKGADLNDMAVFAHVVGTRGFTTAGARLGLSKSAVSKAVARLEAALGVRLLHRTTRSLRVTEAGEALYAHAAELLAIQEAAEHSVGRLRTEPAGRLRVNAPVAIGRTFVTDVVLAFMAENPAVHVEFTLQDDYVDLIETATDVAIRVGKLSDSRLMARQIATVRFSIVATPEYLKLHGTPETPADLTDHAFVNYSLGSGARLLLTRDGVAERVQMTGRLSTNSGDVITRTVLAGQAIAMLPHFYVAEGLLRGLLIPV